MLQEVGLGHKSIADYTHIVGRDLIAEIRELPATSEEYDDYIIELMNMVEEHVAEEEDVLFPELEERMPETLTALTDEIIRFKERMVGSTEDLESRS